MGNSNVSIGIGVLAIIGALIAIVLAVVAFFFPSSPGSTGIYNDVQTISLVQTVMPTNDNYAGQIVDLSTFSPINGTLFLITNPVNVTTKLTPIVLNAVNMPTNVSFTLFNQGTAVSKIYISGFKNAPYSGKIDLEMGYGLAFFIDEDSNIFYSLSQMGPSYQMINNQLTPIVNLSGKTPKVTTLTYTSSGADFVASLVGSETGIATLTNGENVIFTYAGTGTTPLTLIIYTDKLPTTGISYFSIFNGTGVTMNVNVWPSSVLYGTTPSITPAKYVLPNKEELTLIYNGQTQIYPKPPVEK